MNGTGIPLKSLDMSRNLLHSIGRPSVEQGNVLELLNLRNSGIHRILPGAFDVFTNLKDLYLTGNYINELSPNIFQKLTYLEVLDLSHNGLGEFDAERNGLQNSSLVSLYLQENKLQSVSIRNIKTLEVININKNGYSLSLQFRVQGLTSLQQLYLERTDFITNHHRCVELSLSPLVSLDVSFSESYYELIHCIPKMNMLKQLKLTGSNIFKQNRQYIWINSTQLLRLAIDECHISALSRNMFSSLPNLRYLHASSNQIRFLEPSAFWNVSRLESLILSNNLITHVNWVSFIYLKHLKFLNLDNNPLICSCDILFILQVTVSPSSKIAVPNRRFLTCSDPDGKKSKVSNLDLALEKCEDNWASLSGYALLFPLAIMLFFSGLKLWRLRWHIKYTFFLARAGVGRYVEQCDGTKYLFDAFLAYSEKDLKWVTDHLLKNMDTEFIGEEGLNMCLHHRDWLAGVEITENIRRSIAASRRTIVILSKEFAASYWCRFELAMAHMKLEADKDRSGRLLVILLEKIPDELLCPHIVHILTTKTYLAFPKEEALQKHFWKALKKSMKKELIYQ